MAEEANPASKDAANNNSSVAPASAPVRLDPEPQCLPDSNYALSTEVRETGYISLPSLHLPAESLGVDSFDTLTSTPTDGIPSILIRSTSVQTLPSRSQTMPPPTIQFAPLPELEPRRRNTSLQLGVAARSRLLRNRRMMMAQGGYVDEHGEAEEGTSQYAMRPNQGAAWEERDPGLGDDAVEEAFIALGRLVKDAGKTLWRKMSHKEIRRKPSREGENGLNEVDSQVEKKDKKGRSRNATSSPTSAATSTPAETKLVPSRPVGILKRDAPLDDTENVTVRLTVKEPRHCFEDEKVTEIGEVERNKEERLEAEKGGVWEEEVGENFRRRLSGVPSRDEVSYQPPELPKTEVVQTTVISVCTSTVEAVGNGSRKSKVRAPKSNGAAPS